MPKIIVSTDKAPAAIGTYSQAVTTTASQTTYFSGQIPLDPQSMTLVTESFAAQAHQVFKNLAAVAQAAGGTLEDMVKLNIYLTDLGEFGEVNQVMSEYFDEPYPARAAVEVRGLPKGAQIEIDGIMIHE